ncbi:MAG: hypothetical protein JG776_2166 [Caloramator sp.]|jgi:hypothetical protein|uniref:hypothetical protein n=1 Tax=Caloramator sp. TaxID=1871330 RepID=UPI001DD52210|nr:hypothetical protein [Caloramator sp.]MBZ4664448.1 hypothetical protein [Caloramator sp.]
MEYIGKYIVEDENNYLIRLSKKHLIYLNLIFEFVDDNLLQQTKDLKYFYHEIKQELDDILNPVNDLYNE